MPPKKRAKKDGGSDDVKMEDAPLTGSSKSNNNRGNDQTDGGREEGSGPSELFGSNNDQGNDQGGKEGKEGGVSSQIPPKEKKPDPRTQTLRRYEALLENRFVWQDGKPEPFANLRGDDTVSTPVEWEILEERTRNELLERRKNCSPTPEGTEGEIFSVDFEWRERRVHCETFTNVDLSLPNPFTNSAILAEVDRKLADWDNQHPKVHQKLVQLVAAKKATDKAFENSEALISEAVSMIRSRNPNEWEDMQKDYDAVLKKKVKDFPLPAEYKKRYDSVQRAWKDWSRQDETTDKKRNNDRNRYASDKTNNILRRPSYNGDCNAIYVAFDNSDKMIIFLDPEGIQTAYDGNILDQMKRDACDFYFLKEPNPGGNKRHISQSDHMMRNRKLKPWQCGSDHYGHWHPQAHENGPIIETADSHEKVTATQKQLLLQFLSNTGGCMTRLLDFWFGVWERDLRLRYRNIYRDSPEFARLPPTNRGHDETYCLRVSVCNRPTDYHRDHKDIEGGLVGLVQISDFEGAAMCMNQLGIALDGYKDGAALLFRGTEIYHYISDWTGDFRYAFDHTTHSSVGKAVELHRETGKLAEPKDDKKSGKRKRSPSPEAEEGEEEEH